MRLKRIFSHAPDVDAIILMNAAKPHVDLSFFYATGLSSGVFEGCAAIVYPDHIHVITSALEEESARKGDFDISVFSTREERENLLKKELKELKTIGVNANEITYASYKALKKVSQAEIKDVSDAITTARLTKDTNELSRIKKACEIISDVAEEIPMIVKKGMTELELAAELTYSMQKKGASQPGFSTLVCFGENASEPHHSSDDTVLKEGDFVLVDMGAEYKLYVSDITRTFVFGKADQKQKKMYETVLESQKIALDMMKEGVEACDVHVTVKDFLDKEYKGRFIHGLGHSIGLSVHDGGRMNEESDTLLQEGMVFTVEPGVYIPGYGGVRIEDDVVITKEGVDILTTAGKDFTVI
ncbi:MAG: aminopeptidase P family protein [Candidatus Methanofastidiosia archaeon]|jgi:Xaa-Pro dipeptidase